MHTFFRSLLLPVYCAFCLLNNRCTPDKPAGPAPCNCPIPAPYDQAGSREKESHQGGYSVQPEFSASANILPKLQAKLKVAGSYSQSDTLLREVYTEVLAANPDITQKALLFHSVACGLYTILCQDTVMPQQEKTRLMTEVAHHYEKNLREVLRMTDLPKGGARRDGALPPGNSVSLKNAGTPPPTIPVLIYYSKDLLPRIFINGERLATRDTFLPERRHAWLCAAPANAKSNVLEIQDRSGITRCKEDVGPLNRPYQTIYPCL
jgi:hypothetical protein